MKWISVNDKLPKHTEWVLVYADGAMATRAYNAKTRRFEDWEQCQAAGVVIHLITHWAHLPKPPRDDVE